MSDPSTPRVVIVDDHALFRAGVRGSLGREVDVVAESGDVEGAVRAIEDLEPDVVLLDDFDPIAVSAFLAQPAELSTLQALRAGFRTVFGEMSDEDTATLKERTQLAVSVPELRAAMLDQLASAMRALAEAIAERTGRAPSDIAVRTLTGAVVGVAVAVEFVLLDDPTADLATLLDEAMGQLEAGLQL